MGSGLKIEFESSDFKDGFKQSLDTSIRNLADQSMIEMSKLAPWLTGALVGSLQVQRLGDASYEIDAHVPYAVRRNFENNLNPQTKNYIENSVDNVAKGAPSRWWKSEL